MSLGLGYIVLSLLLASFGTFILWYFQIEVEGGGWFAVAIVSLVLVVFFVAGIRYVVQNGRWHYSLVGSTLSGLSPRCKFNHPISRDVDEVMELRQVLRRAGPRSSMSRFYIIFNDGHSWEIDTNPGVDAVKLFDCIASLNEKVIINYHSGWHRVRDENEDPPKESLQC